MSASQEGLCSMELVTVIRLNRISTEKLVEGKGKNTTCTQMLFRKQGSIPLGYSDRRSKSDLREISCESVDWFHLSTERTRLQAPMNTEI